MISSELKLKSDLRKKSRSGVYFLYGECQYKAEFYLRKIIDKFAADAEVVRLYASETQISDIENNLATMSLFGGDKVVILKELDKLKKPVWQVLNQVAKNMPESAMLIALADKIDRRKKDQKEFAAKLSYSVEFKQVHGDELPAWIQTIGKEKGLKVSPLAQSRLAVLLGNDLFAIDHALERANIWLGKGNEVTEEAVDAVCVKIRSDSIFTFVEAVCARQHEKSLELLQQMWQQGEDAIPLTALLARQFRWLHQIKLKQNQGMRANEIRQSLKLYPGLADRLQSTASRTDLAFIQEALEMLEDTDFALKFRNIPPRYSFEQAIMRLI